MEMILGTICLIKENKLTTSELKNLVTSPGGTTISALRVLENGAGIVISTDNVAAQLKTIIPILVEHPSFTKDLGEKARERILERYTITKNINSLEKVYMNLKDN